MPDQTSGHADADAAVSNGRGPAVPRPVAARLRAQREARGISLRALAREVGVSASLVSQIENGKANPSVGTLYALVSALELSLDELFATPGSESTAAVGDDQASPGTTTAAGPVLRADDRPSIGLDTGVRWDRLTPEVDREVDFLLVTYEVGGASCPADALMRHNGREYGLVLAGRLGATVGFEHYELAAGDSIVFASTTPHRFWTIGDEPTRVVWTIVGRGGDA
jgi:transcriptional regulator with XRE-family HTH domain